MLSGNWIDGYGITQTVSGGNTTITNTHLVVATYGSITLTKRILAADINWANGNPIFLFTVTGTRKDGSSLVLHQLVEFTREYVEENTDADGYTLLSCTFTQVPEGSYTATEEASARYVLVGIDGLMNAELSADGTGASMKIAKGSTDCAAVFTNEKYEWQDYSDASCVINTFLAEEPE